VDDERKVGGRSFQTRGPETAKLRDPYVIVLVLGTITFSFSFWAPLRKKQLSYGNETFNNKVLNKCYIGQKKKTRSATRHLASAKTLRREDWHGKKHCHWLQTEESGWTGSPSACHGKDLRSMVRWRNFQRIDGECFWRQHCAVEHGARFAVPTITCVNCIDRCWSRYSRAGGERQRHRPWTHA